jgi:hypothetical protein
MLFPALLASAVAIAVEIPDRSEPGSKPARLAVVMDNGDVLVSRDHDDAGIVAVRCPVQATNVQAIAGGPWIGDIEDALDAEEHELSAASPAPSSITAASEVAESSEQELPGSHACDQPRPAAQVAWFGSALYLACSRGSLYRWREDTGLWRVLPAPAEPEGAPSRPLQIVPERIVAMSAGARLWIVDGGNELWVSRDGERFRALGPVPEPAIAVAEWNGTVIAAGATAVWQRTDAHASWQPLLPMRACALAAHGDAVWLAGPAGLAEMTRDRARVHTIVSLTGAATADGIIWLANGHGPVVRAPLDAVASVRLARPRDPESDGDPVSATVAAGRLHRARMRARWARLLPDVTAQVRWTRAYSQRAMLSEPPRPDPSAARSHDVAFLIWLTWSLGDSGAAFGPATRTWP